LQASPRRRSFALEIVNAVPYRRQRGIRKSEPVPSDDPVRGAVLALTTATQRGVRVKALVTGSNAVGGVKGNERDVHRQGEMAASQPNDSGTTMAPAPKKF
jgi:hypothetical protein